MIGCDVIIYKRSGSDAREHFPSSDVMSLFIRGLGPKRDNSTPRSHVKSVSEFDFGGPYLGNQGGSL